ncbi:hypothetical protein [Neptunomonas antarctica]|uniref:Uncharacterized protein n=1 Tax=Neptunomonas antarctica TaxID=619304 RepID=A0A1N7M905_9GAMM|nr:hypothetical protein [Neptunomonas antarctica]SIS82578.1 hypothetical protein SAMN05421760_105278 [Neptunomonas antarctica]
MAAIFFDLLIAHLIANKQNSLWVQVPLVIVGGITASCLGAYILYLLPDDLFMETARQSAVRAISGLLPHMLITTVFFIIFKTRKSKINNAASTDDVRS